VNLPENPNPFDEILSEAEEVTAPEHMRLVYKVANEYEKLLKRIDDLERFRDHRETLEMEQNERQ